MRIAICDDENSQINVLESYVIELTTDQNIIIEDFYSGEELLKQYTLENNPFDIIFLDMELKGINGIDTAREIRKKDNKVIIIFVTSYSKYVYDSFEVVPFRFLVKPVSIHDFTEVFKLAQERFRTVNGPFVFFSKGKTITLYCDDILYFESFKREVFINTKMDRFSFYSKLEQVYERVQDYNFIYPHKSFIVNIRYITVFSTNEIILSNNTVIPVSRQKSQKVREEYLKYSSRSLQL
jgi:Response regulator of the LytR/AlgR family